MTKLARYLASLKCVHICTLSASDCLGICATYFVSLRPDFTAISVPTPTTYFRQRARRERELVKYFGRSRDRRRGSIT